MNDRPNIVVILAESLGYSDIGANMADTPFRLYKNYSYARSWTNPKHHNNNIT